MQEISTIAFKGAKQGEEFTCNKFQLNYLHHILNFQPIL